MGSLRVIPLFTDIGSNGTSFPGMSVMKKMPQYIERVDVSNEMVSKSFKEIER